MGVRVHAVLVVLALLATVALAVPLAWSSAARRTAVLAEERWRQLAELADAAERDIPMQPLVDRYHEVYGEGVLIVDADGQAEAAHALGIDDTGVAAAVNTALIDAPASPWPRITPWRTDPIAAAAGIRRDGDVVGAVVIAVETRTTARSVTQDWLWLGLGCVGLLALALLAARALTRWVVRPLDGLERAVAEMTEGVSGPPADVSGPPELRHFTAAFNTMAQVVHASLDRQRRLIADASHQLRNPLAAVRLRADSLEDYLSDAGRSTYSSLTAELERFENLLQQLLRLARAEHTSGSRQVGLAAAPAESADVLEAVEDRVAYWQPLLQAQQQHVTCLAEGPVPRVAAPRVDVEQLLDVALENALRYAGSGATVEVTTERTAEFVELVVADDGCGLPDADYPKAASRFWRRRHDGSGTGLGLAIATEIAAGHGGDISVGKAPQGGLLVRFVLPVAGDAT